MRPLLQFLECGTILFTLWRSRDSSAEEKDFLRSAFASPVGKKWLAYSIPKHDKEIDKVIASYL